MAVVGALSYGELAEKPFDETNAAIVLLAKLVEFLIKKLNSNEFSL